MMKIASKEIKACIFDLDGTLLDSMHIWQDVDRKYLARYGIVFDPSFSEDIKNMTFKESAKYFIERFKIPRSEEEIMNDWNEMMEIEYRDHIQLKPYVKEFLTFLYENKIPMCIATSCNKEHAFMALNRLGIASYFSFVVTSSEIGKNKEHPDIFMHCVDRLGYLSEEVVVFEDLHMALCSAKKAGCLCVGIADVLSAHEKEEMLKICDQYLHSFKELLDEL